MVELRAATREELLEPAQVDVDPVGPQDILPASSANSASNAAGFRPPRSSRRSPARAFDIGCTSGHFEWPGGGIYSWSLNGNRLTLKLVREGPCSGRTDTLTFPTWTRMQ